MISEKLKRKKKPNVPKWKRALHYLIPVLLLCFASYLVFIFWWISTPYYRIPIVVVPPIGWIIGILGVIVFSFFVTHRLRLHILANIMIWLSIIIIICLMTLFPVKNPFSPSKIDSSRIDLPSKSFKLVHQELNYFLIQPYKEIGQIDLYSCDKEGICESLHSWLWGPDWKFVTIAKERPKMELQHLDDFILFYANGKCIYKLDIETESPINC